MKSTEAKAQKSNSAVVSAASKVKGLGTAAKPWELKTPPGTSEFQAYRDAAADPPVLVVQVGKTQLRYHLRCIEDLHAMLKKSVADDGWVPLGSADEQKAAVEGTVEAWGRSTTNPVKGWYGVKKGLRGRFGMYVPPVLEALGLAEVEHNPKNNRMRARGTEKSERHASRRAPRGPTRVRRVAWGSKTAAYFVTIEVEAGRVTSSRDFRYATYTAAEAEFEVVGD